MGFLLLIEMEITQPEPDKIQTVTAKSQLHLHRPVGTLIGSSPNHSPAQHQVKQQHPILLQMKKKMLGPPGNPPHPHPQYSSGKIRYRHIDGFLSFDLYTGYDFSGKSRNQ
ncbi:hypothetical protein D3C75_873880 [compost metagenome]